MDKDNLLKEYGGCWTYPKEVINEIIDNIVGTYDDIDDARDDAINAIEEKGQQTLESIPSDYTELSEDVSQLKDDLNDSPKIAETDAEDVELDFADNSGYVVLRLADGHIETKNFNSADLDSNFVGCEYKISNSDLLIAYGYNSTYDAVVVLNVGRNNDLFDFSKFALKPKGTPLASLETADLTVVWTSDSDFHGPFQFNATANADGIYASSADPNFTGGNHTLTYNDNSIKTASSKFVHYYADGKPVTTGSGRASVFEIRWANNVQAYNCVKADGTGRTSLVEYHDMIFDGVRFNEEIRLVPQEAIKMELWYGLQFGKWNSIYDHVRFIDGTNRGIYVPTDSNIKSGNNVTSGIVAWGNDHTIEMLVDTTIDLGKRDYYTGDSGGFISGSKGYFYIIYQGSLMDMAKDSAYYLRGSYRFCPTVLS